MTTLKRSWVAVLTSSTVLAVTCSARADTHVDTATRDLNRTSGAISLGGNDGSVGYSYEFQIPAARGRYQPKLKLSYSSGGGPSAYGQGWDLGLSYIDRSVRAPADPATGLAKPQLWLVLNGSRSYLAQVGSTTEYRPDVSHDYFSVQVDTGQLDATSSLVAYDAVGNTYTFGCEYGAAPFLRFLLTRVVDVDGNTTRYHWRTPDNGLTSLGAHNPPSDCRNAVLDSVEYNNIGQDSVGSPATFVNSVALVYDATNPSPESLSQNGALVSFPGLLNQVRVRRLAPGSGFTILHSYTISYTTSAATGRGLLTQIDEQGKGTEYLAPVLGPNYPSPTRFEYSGSPGWAATNVSLGGLDWPASYATGLDDICKSAFDVDVYAMPNPCYHAHQTCSYSATMTCSPQDVGAWIDLDGDGRPDLVFVPVANLGTPVWWRNTSTPGSVSFAAPQGLDVQGWAGVVNAAHPSGEGPNDISPPSRITDYDGDGLPDLIDTCSTTDGTPGLGVRFGTGGAFAAQVCLKLGAAATAAITTAGGFISNTGTSTWYLSHWTSGPSLEHQTTYDLADLNGDGVLDLIVVSGTTWNVYRGLAVDKSPSGLAACRGSTPCPAFALAAVQLDASALTWTPGFSPIRVNDPSTGRTYVDLVDVNGDGLPDRLQTQAGTSWSVQYNLAAGWSGLDEVHHSDSIFPSASTPPPPPFDPICTSNMVVVCDTSLTNCCTNGCSLDDQNCYSDTCQGPFSCVPYNPREITGTIAVLMDLDRDGRPDHLSPDGARLNRHLFADPVSYPFVDPNDAQPVSSTLMPAPSGLHQGNQLIPLIGRSRQSLDLDGDGILDLVEVTSRITDAYSGTDERLWSWTSGGLTWTTPPDLLTVIHASSGLKTSVTYDTSARFGYATGSHAHPVLVSSRVEGPGVAAATTNYSYDTPLAKPLWYQPSQFEPLGFTHSVVTNTATGITTTTSWAVEHAFAHLATGVSVSTVAGAQVEQRAQAPMAAPVNGQGCRDLSSLPFASDYPVVVYERDSTATRFEGSTSLSSRRYIGAVFGNTSWACSQVDSAGNILLETTEPDTASPLSRTSTRTFAPTSASCKNCVVTETTEGSDGTLAARRMHYDGDNDSFLALALGQVTGGHLKYIEELVASSVATGSWEIASRTSYVKADQTGRGNVLSVRKDYAGGGCSTIRVVLQTFDYDSFGLQVVRETTADDGGTVLVTDTSYDAATGLKSTVTGPYLAGAAGQAFAGGSASTAPVSSFLYDGFNRLLAVGRGWNGTSIVNATVRFSYQPPSETARGSVTSGSFLDGGVTVDAQGNASAGPGRASQSFYDALGRKVETIATGSSYGTLVSDVVEYDAGGRVVQKMDPFRSSAVTPGSYCDWTASCGSSPQTTWFQYDTRNRVVCSSYGWSYAPPVNCVSDFTEGSVAYRRATRTSYGYTSIDRLYFTVSEVPAWRNTSTGAPADVHFLDATGRTVRSRDALSNDRVTTFDAFGRTIAFTRYAGTAETASESTTSTTQYDLRGRVVQEFDKAFGLRVHSYLPTGETLRIGQNPSTANPYGIAGVEYQYGSLGRQVTKNTFERKQVGGTWTTVRPQGATYAYDVGDVVHGYTVGRLASETSWEASGGSQSVVTTVSYGYDIDGRTIRRDQTFPGGPSGTHTGLFTYLNDGTPQSTTITSPYLTGYPGNLVTTVATVDPGGYLQRLDDGAGNVFFRAAGAYDALGRNPDLRYDNDFVQETHTFSGFSNLVQSHTIQRFPVSGPESPQHNDILDFQAPSYQGTKLLGYTDAAAGTTFSYTYQPDGWLTSAIAGGGSTPISQTFNENYSNTRPGGGNLDNLESVSESAFGQSKNTVYNYPSGQSYVEKVQSLSYSGSQGGADALTYDSGGDGTAPANAQSRGLVQQFQNAGLSYDAENRLTGITSVASGTPEEALSYDAQSRLVRRTFPMDGEYPHVKYYVGGLLTLVQQGGVTWAYAHVSAGGSRIASLWSNGATTGEIYYHYDRLGSVVATTTAGGALGMRYRYGTYGALQAQDGSAGAGNDSELGYAGALKLSERLLHMNARAYSPELRKFVQPDNVDFERYSYVRGDPIGYVDPTGHSASQQRAAAAAMGAGYSSSFLGMIGADIGGSFGSNADGGTAGATIDAKSETEKRPETDKRNAKGLSSPAAIAQWVMEHPDEAAKTYGTKFEGEKSEQEDMKTAYWTIAKLGGEIGFRLILNADALGTTLRANQRGLNRVDPDHPNDVLLDPNHQPLIKERNPSTGETTLREAPLAATMAHELGHLVRVNKPTYSRGGTLLEYGRSKDDGPGYMNNVIRFENPIRSALGYWPRAEY